MGEGKTMAKSMMDQDMLKVLYSEEQIRTRVREMEIGRASCRERV